eukprot:CAMPEP_0177639644 /NCGR_PEP_ID=MMETSP0447-20121125/6129_1 /TAXON_ID=0 /ORGANISM="Stygamoeba regulata, Strain BSH-02190019" /LENGTH=286 /DNA_ID=CAMNT_0019141681 /DNA_START=151 /DNA_END=1011 /DNA_ORIENTATION=+
MTKVILIISIVCAFCTVVTFTFFSKLRRFPIKLIIYLSICIVFAFTFFLLAFEDFIYKHEPACVIVGVFVHYFFLADFAWCGCIAFNFYQMIVRRNREVHKMELFYHIFAWGAPAAICIATGASLQYDDGNNEVCYIKSDIAIFVAFFIPGVVVFSCCIIFFFFVIREIHETLAGAPQQERRQQFKEMRVYMSIIVSIGLGWLTAFLVFVIPNDTANTVLTVIFTISAGTQGVVVFIAYCINNRVAAAWLGFLGICIPPLKDVAENLESTMPTSSQASARSGRSAA